MRLIHLASVRAGASEQEEKEEEEEEEEEERKNLGLKSYDR